jgi:AcrR family transcriptional regulator
VSPRGVATLDLRPRLFEAADRVLERDGPTGLSSRAITAEAGTATGLLFRMSSVHLLASGFVERAGSGTVADNLTEAALALLPMASRLFEIVHARPSLVPQLVASRMAHGSAGLEEIEREFARYLDAERRLGRIAPDADIESIALALASTVHELSLRHTPGDPSLPERFRRLAATLTSEITS